jgi:lathosterol oxidase
VYFLSAFTTYSLFFNTSKTGDNPAVWKYDRKQVIDEITVSVWSLWVMTAMVAATEFVAMCGYGKVYYNIDDYGYLYLIVTPILFLVFTDTLIYWVHRALHWPSLYWVRQQPDVMSCHVM